MQTFLPYADFSQSAKVLDRARLGKQRVECKQILRALRGETKGWVNHPATRMWRGFETALAWYGLACCMEWAARGYNDSLARYFAEMAGHVTFEEAIKPEWLGDPAFHRSHQSNLIRKLPEHYGPLFPGVPNNLPYVWPTP